MLLLILGCMTKTLFGIVNDELQINKNICLILMKEKQLYMHAIEG